MKVRLVLGSNSQRQTFRIEWGNYFQFIEKFMSNTEHTLENAENTAHTISLLKLLMKI